MPSEKISIQLCKLSLKGYFSVPKMSQTQRALKFP